MAIEDVRRVLRVPGRLALDPTDLTLPYPHGGGALGFVREVELAVSIRRVELDAEEYGGEPVDVLYAGATWGLAALLRQWDPDALARIFPAGHVGVSGDRVIDHPGAVRAGTLMAATAVRMVFSPDDPAAPGVLFRRAVPLVAEQAALALALASPLEVPVVFRALRPAVGEAVEVGRLADLGAPV